MNIVFLRTSRTLICLLVCYCCLMQSSCKNSIEEIVHTDIDISPSTSTAPTTSIHPNVTCNYILNNSTNKFHYPDCYSVDLMIEANKSYFNGTRDDVIAQGYQPCGNCDP